MWRTLEEAFQAGWDAPCEHGIPNPTECPDCRLTPEEIRWLVALHRPYLRATATSSTAQRPPTG
jgi:hypothetical protein